MEAPPPRPAASLRAWSLVGLLMLISAANQYHRRSLSAVADQVMGSFSLSEEQMGVLMSVFYWTYTALMTPGGWLADRVGTWWTLCGVVLGSAAGGLLCGLTPWAVAPALAWWWLAAARGAFGVASAPVYPSAARSVGSWIRLEGQPFANSLVIAAAPLGMMAANLGMSALSSRPSLGWPGAFLVSGAATLVLFPLWAVGGRAAPPATVQASPAGSGAASGWGVWTRILEHRGILALTLSYSTVGYFEYLLFSWLKYYYKEILHLPEETSALYTARADMVMLVTTPLGGLLCGYAAAALGARRGFRVVAMSSMGLATVLLLWGAQASSLPWKVSLLSLALGAVMASEGAFWTAAVRLGGPLGATTGGFVNTGGNLLGAFAPTLTPLIAGWVNAWHSGEGTGDPLVGWNAALAAGGLATLLGLVLWLWVDVERPLAG